MSNQTNKKSPSNRGEIKEKEINMSLRSIWLGLMDAFQEDISSLKLSIIFYDEVDSESYQVAMFSNLQ